MFDTHPLPCMDEDEISPGNGCSLADSEWSNIFESLDRVGHEIMLETKLLSPKCEEKNPNSADGNNNDQCPAYGFAK